MNAIIDTITIRQANKITIAVFGHLYDHKHIKVVNSTADFNLSKGLYVNGILVGAYLLDERREPYSKVVGRGLYGVSLAVLPNYRGHGYGKILIEFGESLPFDYIWGEHHKELNNIDFWLKRRQLLGETTNKYITYKTLRKTSVITKKKITN